MSEELQRRFANWKTHHIGRMYDRNKDMPPVVREFITNEYILELEQEVCETLCDALASRSSPSGSSEYPEEDGWMCTDCTRSAAYAAERLADTELLSDWVNPVGHVVFFKWAHK